MIAARQYNAYQESRGFLGLSCGADCNRKHERYKMAAKERDIAKDAHYKALSSAKSRVGVFSIYAIDEARELFWGTFAQGKGFAKRASMWDLLFMGIGSMGRDEGILAFILRFAMNVSPWHHSQTASWSIKMQFAYLECLHAATHSIGDVFHCSSLARFMEA